eukprot:gene15398-15539_t
MTCLKLRVIWVYREAYAAYYIYKNLGIGATFSFQDQGELSAADAQNLSNGYNNSFVKESTNANTYGRYHSAFLMLGPQYSFLFKKFAIDLRASADNITPYQKSSTARAFGYGGNVGLRYSFSDSFDVGFKVNYVTSSGVDIPNSYNPGTTGRFVTKQPITVLQPTIGISLHL